MANKRDHHSLRPHSSVPAKGARLLAAALPRRLSTFPLLLAALLLGTILLLDAPPAQAQSTSTVTLSADKNPVREGEQVIIKATLSSATAADFSITATVTSVTAESGDLGSMGFEDKRIDFPAGVTVASFIIGTVEDTDHDDETFIVALGTLPSQVTAGATTSLTITIRDYDDALALVSNVGQTSDGALLHRALAPGGNLWHLAQQFTTGANAGGYTLTSIEFNMAEAVSAPANIRAELWSSDTNGDPDSKLASLAVPSTVGTGNVAFYAPANTTLAASTKYFAVLYPTGATEGKWTRTSTNGEDSGAASGWSIANGAHDRSPSSTSWSDYTYELKIRVNGFPAAPAAGTSVWSATLTPRSLGGGSAFGCANAAAGQDKCSATATLTDDDFTYRGESYDIVTLRVNTAGELTFSLDKSLPAYAKRDLVLTAGSAEFPLAEIGRLGAGLREGEFGPELDRGHWGDAGPQAEDAHHRHALGRAEPGDRGRGDDRHRHPVGGAQQRRGNGRDGDRGHGRVRRLHDAGEPPPVVFRRHHHGQLPHPDGPGRRPGQRDDHRDAGQRALRGGGRRDHLADGDHP